MNLEVIFLELDGIIETKQELLLSDFNSVSDKANWS